MIDVALAIDAEAISVDHTTKAAGAYNLDGNFVPGAETTASIFATIFPASGNSLRDMPEGIRTDAQWVLWSRVSIAVDDRIDNAGVNYRVLYTWPRPEGGFTKAALGRVTL